MMFRFLLLLVPFLLYSAPLKIISLKERNDTIYVTFNQAIKQSDFQKHSIKNGIYYDVRADLSVKRQSFKLDKGYITIAQNSPTIARIVIESKNLSLLNFDINGKVLSLSFSAKSQNAKKEKSKESSIANLFETIDSSQSTTQSSATKPVATSNTSSGSKIIVLDPGHGGKDCGAQVETICEKTIVLDIAKLASDVLKARGYKVLLTRSGDKYISLTDRTKFANDKNADIFVSIHANALNKKSKNYATANGIETYFLSTARSERARNVAEAENKDDVEVMNYFSKLSFLNSLNAHRLLASNKLAIDIQAGMLVNARKIRSNVVDGGVREGPFWVLAGALMPSILVEVGYMTNKQELENLHQKDYQQSIANGIADGIDNYFLKNF